MEIVKDGLKSQVKHDHPDPGKDIWILNVKPVTSYSRKFHELDFTDLTYIFHGATKLEDDSSHLGRTVRSLKRHVKTFSALSNNRKVVKARVCRNEVAHQNMSADIYRSLMSKLRKISAFAGLEWDDVCSRVCLWEDLDTAGSSIAIFSRLKGCYMCTFSLTDDKEDKSSKRCQAAIASFDKFLAAAEVWHALHILSVRLKLKTTKRHPDKPHDVCELADYVGYVDGTAFRDLRNKIGHQQITKEIYRQVIPHLERLAELTDTNWEYLCRRVQLGAAVGDVCEYLAIYYI